MTLRFGPVYLNGRLVPPEAAALPVLDRGVLFGDGLYETMRSRRKMVFRPAQHLERMRTGMRILRIGVEPEDLGLHVAIEMAVDAAGFENGRVRLTVTRGIYNGSYAAEKAKRPSVIVTVQEIDAPAGTGPVEAIVSSFRRDEKSPISRAKTLNFLPSVLARSEAQDAGVGDAVMLNTAGLVAEATASNIFMARGGRIITPDLNSGILAGVTRAAVIEIAGTLNLEVEERPLKAEELGMAEEIFLTSSIAGIRPVSKLNGRPVGQGTHEMGQLLADEYAKLLVVESG